VICLTVLTGRLAAQADSNRIRLSARGTSDAQPGILVLSGVGLDSVRAIIQRDLTYSDRFFVPPIPDSIATLHGQLNPTLYQDTGAAWLVELEPAIHGVDVKLYDARTGALRNQATVAAPLDGIKDDRLAIHRISDQIVGWTGGVGIAATRIAFVMGLKQVWRIDSDGANLVRVSPADDLAMSPAWSPDGSLLAYSVYRDAVWTLYVQKLAGGAPMRVPNSSAGSDYGPAFSPDGRTLAFAHGAEKGSDIEVADLVKMCCAHRLTFSGALADNVTPTYSPDGNRIAFMSTRSGTPELYVMDNDGTDTHQLVSSAFDANDKALPSYTPSWSPDNAQVVFGRDTQAGGAGRRLFSVMIRSGQVVERSNSGQNEDPSFAPDSRHVVFKSRRSGREQLWILDLESGATRQLPTPGVAQVPAWSRTLGPNP
jgi:TolB protein